MEPTEPEITKIEDRAWDALEGVASAIPEINITPHQCDHDPNLLIFERTVPMPTYEVHIYRCACCGETVTDYVPFGEDQMN